MQKEYGNYGGVKVVAAMIGRTEKAVRRMHEKGALPPPVRTDSRLIWDLRDIEAFMQSGKQEYATPNWTSG